MSEPEPSESAKLLVYWLRDKVKPFDSEVTLAAVRGHLVRLEAEARQQERNAIRTEVETLMAVERHSVLAILDQRDREAAKP